MMKKLLLTLFVGLIGLINFGYCETITNYPITVQYTSTSTQVTFKKNDKGIQCFNLDQSGTPGKITIDGNTTILNGYRNYCVETTSEITLAVNNVNRLQYYYFFFPYEGFIGSFYPKLTSQQCQSEYNLMPTADYTSENCEFDFGLIPLSSVNQNYCVSNGLCPSSSCSGNVNTGDIQWSALYINQIQHVSAPVINIDIPEEISRDYESDDEEFNLTVGGYNVDTDYIEGVINLQNSKPNQVDLNNIIQVIIPLFVPGLVIILFIYFIFRFLKKIF